MRGLAWLCWAVSMTHQAGLFSKVQAYCWPLLLGSMSSIARVTVATKTATQYQFPDPNSKAILSLLPSDEVISTLVTALGAQVPFMSAD